MDSKSNVPSHVPIHVPFIDLKTQYLALKDKIHDRIQKVLDHGAYINGPEVLELEKKLSEFTKSPFVLACSSGTDALVMPLMALGIGPGDEVITTSFSFIATAEVIHLVGATPVYVDIDLRTFNIDVTAIEKHITHKTKAILPVSLYGQPSAMDEINSLAKKHNLFVIEDAAQSFGAIYKGKRSCNLSVAAGTSFFPAKPLGGYGDGGAVFTQDQTLFLRMKEIREHGSESRYYHTRLGINARLDSLQCAILLVKLERYEWELRQRQRWATRYNEAFSKVSKENFYIQKVLPEVQSAWAQYTIVVPDRESFQKKMGDFKIPTSIHYPMIMPDQPWYKEQWNKLHGPSSEGLWPQSRWAAQHVISLPIYPDMTEAIQDQVIEAVLKGV